MIGLDIGSKYIKICQVEKKGSDYRVVAAAMAAIPEGEAGIAADKIVADRLRSLLKDGAFTTRSTALVAGGPQLLARNFEFPALARPELEGAVSLEVSQSVFADINAMDTDFHVLSETDGKADVLFVGAPSAALDRHLALAQNAGLSVEIVDIDSAALTNCLCELDRTYNNQSVIVLNVGHSYSSITAVFRGELRFIRNVAFGSKEITAEIARMYQVTPDIAEEMKLQPALWNDAGLNIRTVLRKAAPDLLEAMYRTVDYCISRKRMGQIDRVLVTGGAAHLPGLDAFIGDTLGMPAESWNPLTALDIRESGRKDLGKFISIALGAALRQLL